MRLKSILVQISLVLILAINAAAQEAGPQGEQPTFMGMLTRMAFMFVIVFMIFNLLIIKPQRNKLKEQEKLLAGLKRGEQVITSSGMHARVAGIEKDSVLLEIAPNVRVKFEPSHIQKKVEAGPVEKAA